MHFTINRSWPIGKPQLNISVSWQRVPKTLPAPNHPLQILLNLSNEGHVYAKNNKFLHILKIIFLNILTFITYNWRYPPAYPTAKGSIKQGTKVFTKIKSEINSTKPLESCDHDLIMGVHYGIMYGTYRNRCSNRSWQIANLLTCMNSEKLNIQLVGLHP